MIMIHHSVISNLLEAGVSLILSSMLRMRKCVESKSILTIIRQCIASVDVPIEHVMYTLFWSLTIIDAAKYAYIRIHHISLV